jgi:predicted MarR family transcription regulator
MRLFAFCAVLPMNLEPRLDGTLSIKYQEIIYSRLSGVLRIGQKTRCRISSRYTPPHLLSMIAMSRHPTKIVSSEHLVSETSAELSEFEYGLIMVSNAFNRWMVRCMSAAGAKDMTAVEVSLLHHVSHRDRKKKLADICFVLNIEDTHVATYALKKLVARGYVQSEKTGKEVFFSATQAGRELCAKYREVRESCLMTTLQESGLTNEQIGEAAQLMRNASGLYDTAARAAASL